MSEHHVIVALYVPFQTEEDAIDHWKSLIDPILDDGNSPDYDTEYDYPRGTYKEHGIELSWHSKSDTYWIELILKDYNAIEDDIHGEVITDEKIESLIASLKSDTGMDFKLIIYGWYDGTDPP